MNSCFNCGSYIAELDEVWVTLKSIYSYELLFPYCEDTLTVITGYELVCL